MKIACIVAAEYEDSELGIPVDRLRAAGHEVDIIGMKAGLELVGKKGKEKVITEKGIDDVEASAYDALLIPGGHSPDYLRADRRFVELVKAFDRAGKLIAAVCHGPQLLLSAGLVKGRRLTAWATVQGDLQKAGATVEDKQVVVDRNWISSRKPEDLEAFSREIIAHLGRGSDLSFPQTP
jgi:protease I